MQQLASPRRTHVQATVAATTTARLDERSGPELRSARVEVSRALGIVVLGVGVGAAVTWMVWRAITLDPHPVTVVFFVAELIGVVAAVCVAVGMLKAASPLMSDLPADTRDCHRYANAIADLVGRSRSADVHRDVRVALKAAPRWRPRGTADTAFAAMLAEGPRRLILISTLVVGLLVGASPFPPPPMWAIAAAALGYGSLAVAHVALSHRRVRFGDRQRWSYGSIGEIVARSELAGHATRSWTGALGVTVALSVAVALRGMSDRWTHGLPNMTHEHRLAAFATAIVFVIGALHTMATTLRPAATPSKLVSRRLEESTARQSLVAAAIVVGVVGLVAGLMPDGAETTLHRSTTAPGVAEATDGPAHDDD